MSTHEEPPRPSMRRVWISSFTGTTIEYYDFGLYTSAAALVFAKVYFANLPPAVASTVSLATLAVGYFGRLFGALVFGHFGDKLGRKKVLVTTMTVMGVSSGLIGLLPTTAQIGIAAPLLLVLLRIFQGIAVGGELGGAVLMTGEHSTAERRGLAASAASMGQAAGGALGAGAMAILVALLGLDALIDFGWRIPFVISFLLLAVGLYIRLRVPESPVFLEAKKAGLQPRKAPVRTLLRDHWRPLIISIAVQLGPFAGSGVFGGFVILYATTIGYSPSIAILSATVGTIFGVITSPMFAALSDRIGRKPVLLVAATALVVLVFPAFYLINLGNTTLFLVTVTVMLVLVGTAAFSVSGSLLTELFPTEVRYSAVSISFSVAITLGYGCMPLVANLLLAGDNGRWTYVAGFAALVALISIVVMVLFLKETRGRDLRQVGRADVIRTLPDNASQLS